MPAVSRSKSYLAKTQTGQIRENAGWVQQQLKSFTAWVNFYLSKGGFKIDDLAEDFSDGVRLIRLVEIISGDQLPVEKGSMKLHKIQNLNRALAHVQSKNITIVISSEDIYDCNLKMILGFIWVLILRYEIQEGSFGDAGSGREILLSFAQKVTAGYKDCEIKNLGKCWQDGNGFCALINYFRPDLLDYDAVVNLDSETKLNLSFEIAKEHLQIPIMLETKNMIGEAPPDERSVMCYLAMYYRSFGQSEKGKSSPTKLESKADPSLNLSDDEEDEHELELEQKQEQEHEEQQEHQKQQEQEKEQEQEQEQEQVNKDEKEEEKQEENLEFSDEEEETEIRTTANDYEEQLEEDKNSEEQEKHQKEKEQEKERENAALEEEIRKKEEVRKKKIEKERKKEEEEEKRKEIKEEERKKNSEEEERKKEEDEDQKRKEIEEEDRKKKIEEDEQEAKISIEKRKHDEETEKLTKEREREEMKSQNKYKMVLEKEFWAKIQAETFLQFLIKQREEKTKCQNLEKDCALFKTNLRKIHFLSKKSQKTEKQESSLTLFSGNSFNSNNNSDKNSINKNKNNDIIHYQEKIITYGPPFLLLLLGLVIGRKIQKKVTK